MPFTETWILNRWFVRLPVGVWLSITATHDRLTMHPAHLCTVRWEVPTLEAEP